MKTITIVRGVDYTDEAHSSYYIVTEAWIKRGGWLSRSPFSFSRSLAPEGYILMTTWGVANFERTFSIKLAPGEYCQMEIKEVE